MQCDGFQLRLRHKILFDGSRQIRDATGLDAVHVDRVL
jgi:hypothetical protein